MSSIDDKRICQESCGIQRENNFKSFYSSDFKGYTQIIYLNTIMDNKTNYIFRLRLI